MVCPIYYVQCVLWNAFIHALAYHCQRKRVGTFGEGAAVKHPEDQVNDLLGEWEQLSLQWDVLPTAHYEENLSSIP